MTEHKSPRVNSAHMSKYVGRTVILACEVLSLQDSTAIVRTSDGGQVHVQTTNPHGVHLPNTYAEIIGTVLEPGVLKAHSCIDKGNDFDLSIVNKVVELWHDPRFAKMV